jgi:ACS family tartrate transporter-like MFS transporter
MPDIDEELDAVARSARRKVAWRLLPLLFAMYVIAYLDRANAGFAMLQMRDKLGFDPAVFGWGLGLFYVGYLLLEIPGALIVEHWSARKWFTRILVTWGTCSMGMALVQTPAQFYAARFLLGLAEAGFFPGVIVYFTHWFPRKDRALAMSAMLLAVPGSLALGANVSAVLLRQDWFGLAGWQWVFLVEGAPAVLLGLAVPFVMTDRPRDARWLTPDERDRLEHALAGERRETTARTGHMSLGEALRLRTVWLLALGILATNLGGMGLVFWLATMVKTFLGKADVAYDDSEVLQWTGVVFACGTLGVFLSGLLANRTGHWKWCCVAGQVGAGVFLLLSAIPGQPWALVFTWLCLAGFFANFWFSPYWVLPTLALTSSAAAVSIGFINMCANVPGFASNTIMGYMEKAGLSDSMRLVYLAGGFILGGVFVGLIRIHKPSPTGPLTDIPKEP